MTRIAGIGAAALRTQQLPGNTLASIFHDGRWGLLIRGVGLIWVGFCFRAS